ARSRKHIETFYDTTDIGKFPERRRPLSFHCPLTQRDDVMNFNEIFGQLSLLKLAVYAPVSYILPSRLKKYEEIYDTQVEGGKGKLKQIDRERSLQALMTTNLLKRLESSVEAFRLTLGALQGKLLNTLQTIEKYESGQSISVTDFTEGLENLEAEEDDLSALDEVTVGGKVQISLADMDVEFWKNDLNGDLQLIESLLASMQKITPEDDAKLQH
ncbi:MAG: ATP-dependent helicase, partial [Planctomycetes bacterium]|nr:ATP-dependent helicase [Planctomycetota bacterium]